MHLYFYKSIALLLQQQTNIILFVNQGNPEASPLDAIISLRATGEMRHWWTSRGEMISVAGSLRIVSPC